MTRMKDKQTDTTNTDMHAIEHVEYNPEEKDASNPSATEDFESEKGKASSLVLLGEDDDFKFTFGKFMGMLVSQNNLRE